MNILLWILFGALVGWIASLIMKSKRRGIIRNIVVGLLGAVIGGLLASLLGIGSLDKFTVEGFVIALGGAVLLIWLLRRL
ncbi:MAG: GlsB/YeaQ/YmgE family stress response membrane protein [Acholeplasmatales bacterium]|nr:MAG: GlsB/YeaQ/YmgE family stress response membrane protein [Acholeplasmatales bacterium]